MAASDVRHLNSILLNSNLRFSATIGAASSTLSPYFSTSARCSSASCCATCAARSPTRDISLLHLDSNVRLLANLGDALVGHQARHLTVGGDDDMGDAVKDRATQLVDVGLFDSRRGVALRGGLRTRQDELQGDRHRLGSDHV